MALSSFAPLGWVDRQIHDWLTRQLPQRSPHPGITIVDIDERSLAEIGPWPWPRPVVAQLMHGLRQRGAALQVWDMFFPEAATGDNILDSTLALAPDVVLGQVLVLDSQVRNPPHLGVLKTQPAPLPAPCAQGADIRGYFGVAETLKPYWAGHISTTPDSDGVLRRLPAAVCQHAQRTYIPQLSLAAVQALHPAEPWLLATAGWFQGATLSRGSAKFEIDPQGMLTVPYARDHSAWPAVSAAAILAADPGGAGLKGQIVLVGSTALGVADTANTPRAAHAPGLSVHAELLGAALDHGWVTPAASPALLSALITALVAMALLPGVRAERRLGGVVAYAAPALFVPLLGAAMARVGDTMLPVAPPTAALTLFAVGMLLMRADQERRKALQLQQHLLSFLPAPLAHDIVRQIPAGETLGKPCQGILLAVRVQGLERWTSSVDSLQALAVAHAISTTADAAASAHHGVVEHVRGEILVLAWHEASAASVVAALHAGRQLLAQLPTLLQPNASLAYPLGTCACIEAGSYLLGVAGPKNLRRALLLGPASDQTMAMLPFCEELAAPLLVGPAAAALAAHEPLHSLGHFLLPDHPQPRQLFRAAL